MAFTNTSWNFSMFGAGSGYGDDWNPKSNHISIGFIPGYALQSRELLELQTIQSYQTSTTNRCLFHHGQPRIDLEREDIGDPTKSPVVLAENGRNLRVYRNAEFFTNFTTTAADRSWIPTGFWITFPPYLNVASQLSDTAMEETIPDTMAVGDYLGFNVLIRIVTGDGTEFDQFGNKYLFTDPAVGVQNSNAIGAGRLVYEIVNQSGNPDNPQALVRQPASIGKNPEIRPDNSGGGLYTGLFVPIIKKETEGYNFAFGDETVVVQTEA